MVALVSVHRDYVHHSQLPPCARCEHAAERHPAAWHPGLRAPEGLVCLAATHVSPCPCAFYLPWITHTNYALTVQLRRAGGERRPIGDGAARAAASALVADHDVRDPAHPLIRFLTSGALGERAAEDVVVLRRKGGLRTAADRTAEALAAYMDAIGPRGRVPGWASLWVHPH